MVADTSSLVVSQLVFQMSTNIKVCVRVRPENEKERAKSQQPVVCVIDESLLIFDPVRDQAGE